MKQPTLLQNFEWYLPEDGQFWKSTAREAERLAGLGFTVGALSMIGMPLFTGFVSKYLFASAASGAVTFKMITAWVALAVSTTLNAVYFMRTVLVLYTTVDAPRRRAEVYVPSPVENAATLGLVAVNIALGVASPPVIELLAQGLAVFG